MLILPFVGKKLSKEGTVTVLLGRMIYLYLCYWEVNAICDLALTLIHF